jgi:transposase
MSRPPEKSRKTRRSMDDTFKTRVVLEALKETMTLNELASKYEVHPNQIRTWKNQFLENASSVFSGNKDTSQELKALKNEREMLHQVIGQQTMDIEFLKKNLKKLNLL